MEEIRLLIQKRLSQIEDLESGPAIPDDAIEEGINYFGYELYEDFISSDMDKNYTMRISLTGRLVRKENAEENTLEIIDKCMTELKKALKDLNLNYSYRDIALEQGLRKKVVNATGKYNEMNKKIIV